MARKVVMFNSWVPSSQPAYTPCSLPSQVTQATDVVMFTWETTAHKRVYQSRKKKMT